MLSSKEIRTAFIDFFKAKGHNFIPSSPVAPKDDPTLLFTNAGMNQFKDIFLGLRAKSCDSAVNSQKCIRVSGKHNDLEEVGVDTYHHTFFEMLGNWSFDDYFKEEAIKWAWELLVDVYKIDPEKLYVTVFAGDQADGSEYDAQAAELWPKVTGISADKVLAFGKKDNFWEMGDTGPCGPCSEIHIDLGDAACDKKDVEGHKCGVNGDCARYIELWNLVFIQFNRTQDGKLVPLKAKYIDTGAGLERLCAVLQGKHSNYDTDLFMPIIKAVGKMAGIEYTGKLKEKNDIAMRVIADHIRTLTFAITDGASPGNDGRGYVLRRLLRRAARFGRVLDMHKPFIYSLVPVVCEVMGEAFPEIIERADFVQSVVEAEERSFGRTLDRGIEIFNSAAEKASGKIIAGSDAFKLYDTYGFPLDLTELMARERGLTIDNAEFDKLMDEQKSRARAAQKSGGLLGVLNGVELPATDDSFKYSNSSIDAKVLAFVSAEDGYQDSGSVKSNGEYALILDKTCFYAESGGQTGDSGDIKTANGEFAVSRSEKLGDCVLHYGSIKNGQITVGDDAQAIISGDRMACEKNHTATHLLQWALQKTLGKSVAQQGSLVCADYLRFDFTYPKALTAEQIYEVEQLVSDKIAADEPVDCKVMDIENAKTLGAMALFGEKYGSDVRVVAVGAQDGAIAEAFSKEFCGGTHVARTSQIGGFKIVKEESISAGVRRITAITGSAMIEYLKQRNAVLEKAAAVLKVAPEQVAERAEKLIEDNKSLAKQIKDAHKKGGTDIMTDANALIQKAGEKNGVKIITGILPDSPIEQLRAAMDMLKKKGGSAVIVIGCKADDKAVLLVGVTDDIVKKGVKAGEIIKKIAPIINGAGGGRPQMAQAGGKSPEKLPECIEEAKQILKNLL